MPHEERCVGGEFALCAFEIGQPAIEKAVGQEGVHVAIHQVADKRLRRAIGLQAPETIVWRLARPEIDHCEHCVSNGHTLAAADDAVGECANGYPLALRTSVGESAPSPHRRGE